MDKFRLFLRNSLTWLPRFLFLQVAHWWSLVPQTRRTFHLGIWQKTVDVFASNKMESLLPAVIKHHYKQQHGVVTLAEISVVLKIAIKPTYSPRTCCWRLHVTYVLQWCWGVCAWICDCLENLLLPQLMHTYLRLIPDLIT